MSLPQHARTALLCTHWFALFSRCCVDVVQPILDVLPEVCMHKYAACPLLNLLAPMSKRYFHPETAKLFEYPTTGKPTCTSKKPAEQRRAELLAVLGPHLLDTCQKHTRDMLCSLPGSRVLAETYFVVDGDKQPLADAIAECVAETDPSDDSRHGKEGLDEQPDEDDVGPAVHAVGNRAIERLLEREHEQAAASKERPLVWHALFRCLHEFKHVEQRLLAWSKNSRMAFVLVVLVNTCPEDQKAKLRAFLAPVVKALRAAMPAKPTAGTERLLEVLKA